MYYYSIENQQGRHLGFLVLMGRTPDEDAHRCDSGFFALKTLPESADGSRERQILDELAAEAVLCWYKHSDSLLLSTERGETLGKLQQQYLTLRGAAFVLTDLDGTL